MPHSSLHEDVAPVIYRSLSDKENMMPALTVAATLSRGLVLKLDLGSAVVLHQHQIAAGLIELRIENPAAVGRDGQCCGSPLDL